MLRIAKISFFIISFIILLGNAYSTDINSSDTDNSDLNISDLNTTNNSTIGNLQVLLMYPEYLMTNNEETKTMLLPQYEDRLLVICLENVTKHESYYIKINFTENASFFKIDIKNATISYDGIVQNKSTTDFVEWNEDNQSYYWYLDEKPYNSAKLKLTIIFLGEPDNGGFMNDFNAELRDYNSNDPILADEYSAFLCYPAVPDNDFFDNYNDSSADDSNDKAADTDNNIDNFLQSSTGYELKKEITTNNTGTVQKTANNALKSGNNNTPLSSEVPRNLLLIFSLILLGGLIFSKFR